MNFTTRTVRTSLFALLLSLSLLATNALAGPPLICHAFDIGDAQSLPWTSHNWNLSGGETYDTAKLASDTITILDSSQVTLVHMETLRRAALYARRNPVAAKQLLVRLMARADVAQSTQKSNPFAMFDAGYLAEAYKQWLGEENNPAKGVNGYELVEKALATRGNDPQMELAAALIAVDKSGIDARDHAQRAITGAKNDPLLTRNLSAKFLGSQSETLSAMITRNKVAKEQ